MFRRTNTANSVRLSAVYLALGSCSVAALCPAGAQSLLTVKQFETEAHTGPVEKALVGVEVSGAAQNGGVGGRHGNGIVIRCDGFVLTSQALFGAAINSVTQKVMVTLNPGTAEARRVPSRIVGAANMLRRAFAGKPEPLVVLKIADIHAPALRLLLPGRPCGRNGGYAGVERVGRFHRQIPTDTETSHYACGRGSPRSKRKQSFSLRANGSHSTYRRCSHRAGRNGRWTDYGCLPPPCPMRPPSRP